MKNLFLLSWKKILILVIALILAVILHNLIGEEEFIFLIIALIIIPIYLIISILYTLIELTKVKLKKKRK